jgi:hypothetical protein
LVGGSGQCRASALAQAEVPRSMFYDLFLLNIALQLFDGVATYAGMQMGVREANQLLCNAFAVLGVGPGLLLFKAFACGMLLLLYRNTGEEIGRPALTLLAVVYCACSLVPWSVKLISLALPLY